VDLVVGHAWLALAIEGGVQEKAILTSLARRLSVDELRRARALADQIRQDSPAALPLDEDE
jgi:hypothetical protein